MDFNGLTGTDLTREAESRVFSGSLCLQSLLWCQNTIRPASRFTERLDDIHATFVLSIPETMRFSQQLKDVISPPCKTYLNRLHIAIKTTIEIRAGLMYKNYIL